MKNFKSIKETLDKAATTLAEACWDGYHQEGMKRKGDRMVPNCVPDGAPLDEANKGGGELDDRYYYAVYTHTNLKEITGPYKSEQSAWHDHGGDMDEILRGDALKQQLQKGKYKGYTIRLHAKPV